jgi:hypothetical protein
MEVTADFDTTARLDGAMTITTIARDAAGNQSMCTVTVVVDNMTFELVPTVINLRNRNSDAPITAEVDGPNLGLLIPTEDHVIELTVPGGNPVPATQGWDGDDELTGANGPQLKVRFPRSQLVASIQAGLDGGAIPAGANTVSVGLWVDGLKLGTTNVRLVGGR